MPRSPRPDFLLVGAPKAGTSALHVGLAQHPEVFVTTPKEPKYWLCDDSPPPAWRGPGDAHSQREWIWRRDDYARLFEPAGEEQVRGESTPFYLWSRSAHRRIGESLPDVRIVAVVRDPVDRAYSNWMHLWSDGLERVGDFVTAFELEDERVARGYAPFWRYRELGMYGEQLAHLYRYVPREQVLVLRYRELVDTPAETLDRVCAFLGLTTGLLDGIPHDNSRNFVEPGWRPRVVGPMVRAGAYLGQFAPPQVWRRASPPLIDRLSGSGEAHRPLLGPERRTALTPAYAEDVALLEELTGEDFSAWLSEESRGSFRQRSTPAPGTGFSARR